MKCITFGYVVLFSILLSITTAFVGVETIKDSSNNTISKLNTIGKLLNLFNVGVFIWWISGFFMGKCDSYYSFNI